MDDPPSDIRLDLKSRVADLLEHTFQSNFRYADAIADLYDPHTASLNRRFLLHVDRVQSFDAILWHHLLTDPTTTLPAFEEAILDAARDFQRFPEVAKVLGEEPEGGKLHVGFTGEFGGHLLSPRQLSAERMNQLVCLVGIVTRASTVRPKVVKSVHFCEESGKYTVQEYRDVTSNTGMPTGAAYPTKERDTGYILETEYGLCKYINSQMVTIQELPELAPPGLLPRSFDVILEDDLVDQCKPGDRIYATGIYKALVPRGQYQMSGTFRGVLVANYVTHVNKDLRDDITVEEIKEIKKISRSRRALDQLAASLAPTIYGHEFIKKGLVLLLLGGSEANLDSGTHLRGDINCLLVGDPGTAKSQLLRAVMAVCPLAVSTTGRGSTGVGLTAAVVTDPDSGDKRLEAGAMVLADRGVVCIDEFDKMNDLDRVAIHEVMEQQTVTIAKAGIHVALNARCSVVAAANPIHGNYDDSITITRNINLPDSLLSRFDMLFIVLDDQDSERDREIGEFVLDWHQRQTTGIEARPMLENVHSWYMEQSIEESSRSAGSSEGQGRASMRDSSGNLTPLFLRKYVMYAKRRASGGVELTDGACKSITDYYVEVRSTSESRSLPVTPRTLESVIRLATAHAKLRLSRKVEERDVMKAKEIMNVVLRNEPELQQRPRHSQIPAYANLSRVDGDDMEMDTDEQGGRTSQGAATPSTVAPDTAKETMTESTAVEATPDAMEVDTGPDGLTEAQKKAVVSAIKACTKESSIVKLSALEAHLQTSELHLDSTVLEDYLLWITEHYEEQPGVLPQIMYDKGRKEFYDLLQ